MSLSLKVQRNRNEQASLCPPARYSQLRPFLVLSHFLPLFIKASTKMLRSNCLLRSSFPYEGHLCHIKLILNKSECFSLVYLSFARRALAKNLEREKKKMCFSSTLSSTLLTSDPIRDKLQQPHLDCLISSHEYASHIK